MQIEKSIACWGQTEFGPERYFEGTKIEDFGAVFTVERDGLQEKKAAGATDEARGRNGIGSADRSREKDGAESVRLNREKEEPQAAGKVQSKKEKKTEYKPSEEALLKLYMEQLKKQKTEGSAERNAAAEELKALKIARNIMRGKRVPAQDESFLLAHNYKLYMAAKSVGGMHQSGEKAKSELREKKSAPGVSASVTDYLMGAGESGVGEGIFAGSTVGAVGGGVALGASGAVAAAEDGAVKGTRRGIEKDAAEEEDALIGGKALEDEESKAKESGIGSAFRTRTDRTFGAKDNYGNLSSDTDNSVFSTSGSSGGKKKTRKRFYYNFKDVSAQIVNARTSGNARQVVGAARMKCAQLRRKLKTGEYDDEAIQMALVHAEAMERVAKKKMKHLQEEEAGKRGGQCAGDIDRETIKEQMQQDEQVEMERQTQPQAMEETQAQLSPFYVSYNSPTAEFEDMSLEELLADAVANQQPMPDFAGDMEEFIDEFSQLMKDSMEEMTGLEELAEELMESNAAPDMDPEDLKAMQIKHRNREQKDIAEADSKYLKAFFQKLQREQKAAAAGAAMAAAEMESAGGGMVVAASPSGSGRASGSTAGQSGTAGSGSGAGGSEGTAGSSGTPGGGGAGDVSPAAAFEGAAVSTGAGQANSAPSYISAGRATLGGSGFGEVHFSSAAPAAVGVSFDLSI